MIRLFSFIVGVVAMTFAGLYGIVNVLKGNSYGSSKKSKRQCSKITH